MRSLSVKKDFNISMATQMLETLDFYVYFSQKWVYIEEILKLNMFFLIKGGELFEKYNEIWKIIKNSIKKEFDSNSVYKEK